MVTLDFSYAEQRVGLMLEEEYPDYAFIKRVSEQAFWSLVYGMDYRLVYVRYLREHADEEGCSVVFADLIYGSST